MQLLHSLLLLGCCLASLYHTANGIEAINEFTTLEEFNLTTSNEGYWAWSNRANLPWTLPAGPEGFAVMYLTNKSDTLYSITTNIQRGATYQVDIYIAGEFDGSANLKVQHFDHAGSVIDEVAVVSDTSSEEWRTISGTFDATEAPSYFGIYCYSESIDLVNAPYWGCAVDRVYIEIPDDPTTTAPPPAGGIDFTFDDDTAGWLLGRSNGAFWYRFPTSEINSDPKPSTNYVLRLFPQDVYAATALATSPRLRADDSGAVTVRVEYYLSGLKDYPVYLKLRYRSSYTSFAENPIINMDPWGEQMNNEWLYNTDSIDGVAPGDEFNLVLEGNLGIFSDNDTDQIMISRVYVTGVTVIPYEEIDFFDFSTGLVGWQAGSMDGGKWEVVTYTDEIANLGIPEPSGNTVLLLDRYDIHSGVITIESPPITLEPDTTKLLQIRVFIKGSTTYPVIFRIGLKSVGGDYDALPFIDLTAQGNADSTVWTTLDQYTPIPTTTREPVFQLVFEVDLGGKASNLIAIDGFSIMTITN